MKRINYLHPSLFVASAKGRGRGVFTADKLDAFTLIEVAPVVVMNATERKLLDQTMLHDYIFEWGPNRSHCCMAMGYVPLYNHSKLSNCEYEMDFKKELISVKTVRDIKRGEELFINYNGDWNNETPVWFDVK